MEKCWFKSWGALEVFELGRGRTKKDLPTKKHGLDYFYSSGQVWVKSDATHLSQYTRAYSPAPTLAASAATRATEVQV